jgi:hypothetical protein
MKITRKIRQFIDSKIPEYLYKRYPNLINFFYGFTDFVDQECAQDILNLDDNLDPDMIFDKLLNDYFLQYCQHVIDTDQYSLTNENKRQFLSIAKLWYKNKGKTFSFDIALKYLNQFFVFENENYIENIEYEIVEDKNDWYAVYDPPLVKIENRNPYTYVIKGDFPISLMQTMLDNLNPVGFYPEFQFTQIQTEIYYQTRFDEEHEIITNFDFGNPTEDYRVDVNIFETISISSDAGLTDEDIIERYNVLTKPLRYDGSYKYNGQRSYNGIDLGVHEEFSIETYDGGILIDTFEYDI